VKMELAKAVSLLFQCLTTI